MISMLTSSLLGLFAKRWPKLKKKIVRMEKCNFITEHNRIPDPRPKENHEIFILFI